MTRYALNFSELEVLRGSKKYALDRIVFFHKFPHEISYLSVALTSISISNIFYKKATKLRNT